MDRRSLLSAVAIGIIGGAGCLGQQEAQVQLAYFSLYNEQDNRHSAEVKIRDSEELVFSDTIQLLPGGDDSNVTVQNPVDGPGHYVIVVRIAGQSQEVDLLEQATDGQECAGVQFTLIDDGGLENSIESPDEC